MKKLVVFALLLACQKQDDSTTTSTSTSATTTATATETASVTPLATIAPSAAPSSSAMTDVQKRAAMAKQAEQMQMQMLQALGSDSKIQGALNNSNVPLGDLDAVGARGSRDGGASDLRFGGGGGGTIRPGGPGGGGLAGIGARDH